MVMISVSKDNIDSECNKKDLTRSNIGFGILCLITLALSITLAVKKAKEPLNNGSWLLIIMLVVFFLIGLTLFIKPQLLGVKKMSGKCYNDSENMFFALIVVLLIFGSAIAARQ